MCRLQHMYGMIICIFHSYNVATQCLLLMTQDDTLFQIRVPFSFNKFGKKGDVVTSNIEAVA